MFKPENNTDRRFKIYHELMACKIKHILLLSSPYDAWIMEKDRGLSEAIVHEYKGLNLSHPPRLTWADSVSEATILLQRYQIDLVVVVSEQFTSFPTDITLQLRDVAPNIPVIRLYHRTSGNSVEQLEHVPPLPLERYFVWNGDTKLFLASIKSIEDEINVSDDTRLAAIRVIIFVEDSALYLSSLLPVLYEELVKQTQSVMEKGLNGEHRMLAMRIRPKILIASSFEGAMELFQQFEPYVLGVISDVRFYRNGYIDEKAGLDLLRAINRKRFDIPLLMTSSESSNASKAAQIPASFVDKNSPTLHRDVRSYFLKKLGFGEFSFRFQDGIEVAPANDLRELGNGLLNLQDEIFIKHWEQNDFSRWLFTRGESLLAHEIREVKAEDFDNNLTHMRRYLHDKIHARRMQRQKGVIVDFDGDAYDLDTEFLKIGDGSLGGKARGLAFFASWLDQKSNLRDQFNAIKIKIPQTLVLTTECFEQFITINNFPPVIKQEPSDADIIQQFLQGVLPEEIIQKLNKFLEKNTSPLAVRSSSLLEDSKYKAYAGLYSTHILANDQQDRQLRLNRLTEAIKLVYASTYFEQPRAFSRQVGNRVEEEKMAVIIQPLFGSKYKQYFYPALSGVAQSYNFYPFGKLEPEHGIATVALGFGKAVMEGEKSLRFCPKYPKVLPQRSTVDDILKNTQREFHTLQLDYDHNLSAQTQDSGYFRRDIHDAMEEFPIQLLSSRYDQSAHAIRDITTCQGTPVITFAGILKYNLVPLPELIASLLKDGQKAMRCPVEIEFAMDFSENDPQKPELAILQIRPMGARDDTKKIAIEDKERRSCFCLSHKAFGNTETSDLNDIVFVKPDSFDPAMTMEMATQIRKINMEINLQKKKYILIGPGRWGTADRWLGIPVGWSDIAGVGAIVETTHTRICAEPSQGSHFFHNITSLSIPYLSIGHNQHDRIDWEWLYSLTIISETSHVIHAQSPERVTMKIDGSRGIGLLTL